MQINGYNRIPIKSDLFTWFLLLLLLLFCALHLPVCVLERFIAFTIARTWSQKNIVGNAIKCYEGLPTDKLK